MVIPKVWSLHQEDQDHLGNTGTQTPPQTY